MVGIIRHEFVMDASPCGGFDGDSGQGLWRASLVLIMVTAAGFDQPQGITTLLKS